jgi:hypothetical protein
MYRQVGAALPLPQSLAKVLRQRKTISQVLAEPPRTDIVSLRLTLMGQWPGFRLFPNFTVSPEGACKPSSQLGCSGGL